MSSNLSISIIIPTNYFDDRLHRCLKAIEKISIIENFELILVLDGIAQDHEFLAVFEIPNFKVITQDSNQGPAVARNTGASAANGEILFFVDADVAISTETLATIRTNFLSESAPDALIGSYDDTPLEQSIVSKYRNLLHHYTHQTASSKAYTFWGACGAIKKQAFWTIGGFNSNFKKPSVEDIELGYRLVRNNFHIKLDKDVQVKHLKRWTLINTLKTDIFYRAKPWTILLNSYDKWEVADLNIKNEERLAVVLLATGCLCVLFGFILPNLFAFAALFLTTLIYLKRKVYLFFSKYFKPHQLPIVILLHWMYLASALTGFVLGTIDSFSLKVYPQKSRNKANGQIHDSN